MQSTAFDKGKIERVVPLARELFRKLKTIHADLDIGKANGLALEWCRYDNGMRIHGTTHEKPAEAFAEREKSTLLPLPETPFEMATWKQVTVHVDQYIQFEKKTYSLPKRYVGRKLWARGLEKIVQVFDEDFIRFRSYIRTSKQRHTDPADFPSDLRMMLGEPVVLNLIQRAGDIGPHMKAYVTRILEPHAKINFRKVQGILRLADKHTYQKLEDAAAFALKHRIFKNKDFERLLEEKEEEDETIPISPDTSALLRSASYFIHTTPAS